MLHEGKAGGNILTRYWGRLSGSTAKTARTQADTAVKAHNKMSAETRAAYVDLQKQGKKVPLMSKIDADIAAHRSLNNVDTLKLKANREASSRDITRVVTGGGVVSGTGVGLAISNERKQRRAMRDHRYEENMMYDFTREELEDAVKETVMQEGLWGVITGAGTKASRAAKATTKASKETARGGHKAAKQELAKASKSKAKNAKQRVAKAKQAVSDTGKELDKARMRHVGTSMKHVKEKGKRAVAIGVAGGGAAAGAGGFMAGRGSGRKAERRDMADDVAATRDDLKYSIMEALLDE